MDDKPHVRVLLPKVTVLDIHIHKEDEDDNQQLSKREEKQTKKVARNQLTNLHMKVAEAGRGCHRRVARSVASEDQKRTPK